MARSRKQLNNMLIIVIAGFGMLLLLLGRLAGPPQNSFPLLPPDGKLEALVFADLVVRIEDSGPRSAPVLVAGELQGLVASWREAQLVPILPPDTASMVPVQVDVYLGGGGAPITALFYPPVAAVKLLSQEQWWRLVNVEMARLLPRIDNEE